MNKFVIECVNDTNLAWSNTDGWTDGCDFDVFTLDETETLTLPIEGAWIRLNEWIKKGDEHKLADSASRYELIKTDAGFMAYDHDCDEFLYDKWNNNTFDTDIEANKLIEDAVYTNIELEGV